jgi:hypothetical protein
MNKWKKMKNKKYHTVETTPKSSTHIHDCSPSLLSTGASINSVRVKLLLYAQPAHLSEIMWSSKYFQLVCSTAIKNEKSLNVSSVNP